MSESPHEDRGSVSTPYKHPSALACLACRKRHVKCDGKKPVCTRCSNQGIECSYMKSRRGYRARRTRNQASSTIPVPGSHSTEATNNASGDEDIIDGHIELSTAWASNLPITPSETTFDEPASSAIQGTPDRHDVLINTFYRRLWPAHPFTLPRKLWIKKPWIIPDYVKAAMRLTASHYSSSANRRVLLQEANTSSIFQVPDSAFKVQALLLLAMDAYISLENSRGCEIQRQAIEIAKGIGMHRRDYSYLVGQHGPIVQESWRRTWWDCYTLAALTSAIHGTNLVELVSLEDIDVPLPGPCDDYKDCRPPQDLQTLDEMRDRMFTDDNFTFSSFAYKIEATTIMLSALRLSRESFAITDAQIDAIDASIANFLLSLPQDSRQVASRDGAVDELIFAAHMIIHWVTIIMHRPHSSLAILRSHYDTECTKIRTPADVPSSFNLHTSKALDAANALSNLATIRTPLENHTPCFACSIALSATVHLPAYLLESDPTRSQTLKGRLRLALSTLGTLSEIFPIAAIVKRQLGQFARDTFIHPAKTAATRDETNIALDAATTQLPTLTHQAFGAYDDAMPNDFTGADEGSLWLSNLIASGGLEQSDLGMTMDFEANE